MGTTIRTAPATVSARTSVGGVTNAACTEPLTVVAENRGVSSPAASTEPSTVRTPTTDPAGTVTVCSTSQPMLKFGSPSAASAHGRRPCP
ncbi:MAG: hypothetical protein ABS81_24390 [Pseudonocardia sp. SCN 72-86]|nr:MAG: hypothetical protein ABS81_24390 [Pseudonocardia sp. SCN 72-86]